MKNKIGWCNITWNPVWGCNNHCEYCYAREIAKRFWKQMWKIEANYQWKEHPGWAWTGDHLSGLKDFKPTFLNAQFEKPFPKKSHKIFVGSMSEIKYWDEVWIQRAIDKIKEYPQHTFQFLTKCPSTYSQWHFPDNCWLGCTVTKNFDFDYCIFLRNNLKNKSFISFEPLLERITDLDGLDNFDWVIIGAETGNRKGKVIPKREWIEDIVDYCQTNNIPVYVKDSINKLFPDIREYKQFPKNKGGG